jgi:hypothetical protein
MLKRLGLNYRPMVLLVILLGAVFYMSRYAENRKAEHQENAQAGSPNSVISPNGNGQSTQNANKPHQYPSWIDTFAWPDGATAWALFLTLLVIGWQSTETRRTADAALAQIQLTKDKDRARLAIRPGGFGVYWCPRLQSSLEISHFGPREAFSVNGVYGLVVTNSRDIPEWEVWPIERTAGQQLPSVIKPGSDPIVISCSIPFGNKEHDAVENGTGFLHFFGRLDYIDIYGEPRVTPFRYICERQGGEWHERCWVRHGPKSDNTPT